MAVKVFFTICFVILWVGMITLFINPFIGISINFTVLLAILIFVVWNS